MSADKHANRPALSDTEYWRRIDAIAHAARIAGLAGMAITGPLNVPCLVGYDDDGVWPSPVIVTANGESAYVARATTLRHQSI